MTDRMSRIDEALKREITLILQEEINDPRIEHVTITSVEVTRDMTLAKIFYVIPDEGPGGSEAARGLKSASGFIRGELSRRLPMKKMPRISFREDTAEKRQESVDSLFQKIEDELFNGPEGPPERNEDGK